MQYDKLNRLTSVSENGTVIANYSYDNKNNRTQTIVPGGETTSYNYNIANMLTGQITGNKLSETYSYYLNGNQKSKVSNGQTTNYIYDSMNRLVRENDTEYTFDDFGNRHTKIDGEITTTYSYDLNNRLTESIEENGDVTTTNKFFYDNNGNQITKATMVNQPYSEGMSGDYTISNVSDNFVALYEYNCYNQLIGVDTDGTVSSYTYSPDGLRHSKTVGGETTTFVYNVANVIEEITADGTNKYYRGIEIVKNDDGLYYLYNGQGDVSLLIDGSGNTIANYEFDAYGNQSQQNEVYNPFGYRGEYTDLESGLIYLRARMYDAETGRFINEDPIRDGFNWYMYCAGNPIFYMDSTGMAKDGDERFSQSVREEIAIYGQVWADAETAYSLGIIDYYEKTSVQANAESKADEIRYRADYPFKTFFSDAVEFTVFDVLLGDLNGGTVYAADISGPALGKMYGNITNLEAIVKASPVAIAAVVGSSDKGRTLVNTKINGKMTRVDIEFPQGGKPANLHVQIKGKGAQKVMINSMDDLAKLPKSVAKSSVIKEAVKKGLKMLGKLF